ncbi:hypothetical protein [Mycobacteroides saopaulense]|uniref:Uncharacterized protein n=1 Tax=Mycobacteroides saopaulense TaxID=1578165 RepID=A0ABX3BS66_9MYCO|nr:hypothetical protein [Mycobacteroides saopaulense]OHT82500.1 hypothetical protein BKG68_21160 [Mycobacteroides saopaulense]OHU01882.1 hypothetical protein BKG73_24800 [Mycobacteroides saopaulense]
MLLTFVGFLKGEVAVLSQRHRKSSKKVVVQRTVTAAGAVAATASLAFVGPTAQAAAAAPDYKGAVTDYKDALNNYLSGTNAIGTAAGGVWNPVAQGSGGLLPTFGTSLTHSNLTKIADLPDVLRNLASTPLPTAVPGVIPAIKIPGQGFVDLPLPTTIPGANLLNGLANALDGAFNNPIIGPIVNQLPPLSDIVDGLIAEQDKFTAGYNWPLLQASGLTTITNTFVQTPSGLNIKIPASLDPLGILPDSVRILPDGTLPNVTAWVPMGAGNYQFPLGMETGWWATAPTLVVDGGAVNVPQTVLSIPMWATGMKAPLGLGQAGQFNAHVLIPTQNGIYSPVGTTLSNFSMPMLGLGMTNLNVTTGNYLGTNGFNINNGQNVMVLQTPFSGALPIPVVYSLGGFNMGTEGAGFTLPSLFGVGLMPSFQLGTAPGANTPLGVIPPNLIPTGAIVPTQLITVSGLISTALGIPDPTVELAKALTPLYKSLVTPALTPISDLLTQQYGNLFNGAASNTLQASKFYKDVMTQLGSLIGAAQAPLSSPAPNAPAAVADTPAPVAKEAETPAAASKQLGTPVAAPEVKQLEAPKLDLASNLVATKEKVVEKATSTPLSVSASTAPEASVVSAGETATQPAAEPVKDVAKEAPKAEVQDAKDKETDKPAKPVVKEKLQDKVDKANSALKDSATGAIKQTRGAITSTVTNTVESATATETDGSKPSATADASKAAKTKQDNDSGKHHDDGSAASSNKVKVKTPSESGGKHRAPDASGGGSAGSHAANGSDGSGSHGGSGGGGAKHSTGD